MAYHAELSGAMVWSPDCKCSTMTYCFQFHVVSCWTVLSKKRLVMSWWSFSVTCYAMASVREPCEGSRHFIENGCSISYFPLWKPCIIREQCMLWRHSVCDYALKQLEHMKLCFVQLQSTVWRHFVFKLHKRTQFRFVLLYGSLKTQWRHTVLYYWTMHAFLCFNCLKVLDKSYLKMHFLLNLNHFAKSFLVLYFRSYEPKPDG